MIRTAFAKMKLYWDNKLLCLITFSALLDTDTLELQWYKN